MTNAKTEDYRTVVVFPLGLGIVVALFAVAAWLLGRDWRVMLGLCVLSLIFFLVGLISRRKILHKDRSSK